ncbi:MAG: C25 family cysteine peptidase [Muribaculaceae bacterium]
MKRSLIALLAMTVAGAASAFDTSIYSASSALNNGHWVKIATSEQGIHQISYDQLRALGFEQPERVQVYGYGALQYTNHTFASDQPDDLTPTATYHTSDGRILFYGDGDEDLEYTDNTGVWNSFKLRRNYYDTRSYYFLSDYQGLVEVPESQLPTSAEAPVEESHISVLIDDIDNTCPIKGGSEYHNRNCASGEEVPFVVNLHNYLASTSETYASLVFRFAVCASQATTIPASVTDGKLVEYTTEKAWNIAENDYDQFNYASTIVKFSPTVAEQPVIVTAQLPKITYRYCAYDRFVLRYPCANSFDADHNDLVMYYSATQRNNVVTQRFSNVNEGEVVLWLVNRPDKVSRIAGEYDAEARTLQFGLTADVHRVVAFRPEGQFPEVEVIGNVDAQDLHSMQTPDMLIITTAEFMPMAQQIANLHKAYQGLDVAVVEHNQIFNEFSSGARDVMGYRRFAKMLYDRNPAKLSAIMLYGIGAYDNRSIIIPANERLLAYENNDPDQSRNLITCYCSDNIFGMLADNYNHSEIQGQTMQVAVGRVPAITAVQAQSYANKVANYLANPVDPATRYRSLIIAGEGDRNTHAKHCIEVAEAIQSINPDATIVDVPTQLYLGPGYTNQDAVLNIVHDQLVSGVGYLSFSGHGGPTYIANCQVLNTRTAESYTYSSLPFVMLSSCDQFAFDRMQNGLLESMLFNAEGGAIAGVAATRSVYIVYNQHACVPVASAFAAAGADDTFGSVFLDARQRSMARSGITRSGLVNCMSYNLGGDPALPAGASSHRALLTAVNGQRFTADAPLSSDNTVTIKPLTSTTFAGQITLQNGNIDTDFNGTVTLTVLEGARSFQTQNTNNENSYAPLTYSLEYDILGQYEATVTNGRFSVEVSTPVSAVPGADHRVIITARNSDLTASAISTARGLLIDDYDPADFAGVEFDAPTINEFYLDNLSFVPGAETGAEITVHAVVDPAASGLRLSSGDITTRTRLVIDNITPHGGLNGNFSRRDDGTYDFTATIDGLSEGQHTIEFIVANNAGLTARTTTDFVVVTRLDQPELSVDEAPARTVATLNISQDYPDNRLVITDANGLTVFSAENVIFPYQWTLTDTAGADLPDGLYNASLLIRSDSYYGHSTPARILIIR